MSNIWLLPKSKYIHNMNMLDYIKNAISPKPISKSKGSSIGYFLSGNNSIGYELWLQNSDIMSIVRLIADNIYIQIDKPNNNANLFSNIELLKYEFVKNKILWSEFIVAPIATDYGKVIWFNIFGKDRYNIKYDEYINPISFDVKYNNNHIQYLADEVIYICYNNDKGWKPKGIIDDIIEDICIDLEASSSLKEYYKNRIALSFFMKLWSDVDGEKLNQELQKFYSGSKNSWKWLANEDIESIQPMQTTWLITQPDREYVTEKICSALNIPKEILWYTSKWWSEAKIKWLLEIFDWRILKPRNIRFQDVLDKTINKRSNDIDNQYKLNNISVVMNNKKTTDEIKLIIEQVKANIITTDEARTLLWLDK